MVYDWNSQLNKTLMPEKR